MVLFDDLGFRTDYEVESDIEYPGDGDWGLPIVVVGEADGLPSPAPVAIVRPTRRDPFVLSTSFSELGSLYATPSPRHLCVFDRFAHAVFVDVDDPSVQETRMVGPTGVAMAEDENLMLIYDDTSVTAIGEAGVVWRSGTLFDHDLRIRRTDNGRIVCRGWDARRSPTEPVEVTLDAGTGEVR